jgi:hypothetical protein
MVADGLVQRQFGDSAYAGSEVPRFSARRERNWSTPASLAAMGAGLRRANERLQAKWLCSRPWS